MELQADGGEDLKAAELIKRSAKRSAAAQAARRMLANWKRRREDWGDSSTPLSLDLWTRVLQYLCTDIELKGVRGVSVIARDLCNAGMACKELYVSAAQAQHRLAALCHPALPMKVNAAWTCCLQEPMALKLDELKELASRVGLQKFESLLKPTLALGLLKAWDLQCPTSAHPRVIMEVARERQFGLIQRGFGDLRKACQHIPELHGARDLSVFRARQACTKLGLTSLALLNTATHEAKRSLQERLAAARKAT